MRRRGAMKSSCLLHIVVIAVSLAPALCAGQDSLLQTQFPTGPLVLAQANTVEANAESDDSDSKTPSVEDRRDRIFYPGDTERPKPLLRKLALNIVLDEKDIFTSPFHVNRHNALEWLVPIAITGGLMVGDRRIAGTLENSRGQVAWGGRISNIGASYTLIPIVASSYVYGAWRDNPKGREIGVLGTETLLDSLIVVEVLKEIFRRDRPDDKHPGDFWAGDLHSRPVTRWNHGPSLLCWIMNSNTRKSSASLRTPLPG